ncbi:MAG: DUF2924 domain-containing protein [Burkholderiales bacterium]
MVMLDVDFEVFKELTARRRSETMTENEVIREVLGLSKPANHSKAAIPSNSSGTPWVSKGIVFPHGTEFRATYKGQQHLGTVQNGALVLNGKRFSSPSAAAVAITSSPVNGWMFWECLIPGTTKWKTIADLRK